VEESLGSSDNVLSSAHEVNSADVRKIILNIPVFSYGHEGSSEFHSYQFVCRIFYS